MLHDVPLLTGYGALSTSFLVLETPTNSYVPFRHCFDVQKLFAHALRSAHWTVKSIDSIVRLNLTIEPYD